MFGHAPLGGGMARNGVESGKSVAIGFDCR
jgi:hypothetical protein